MMLNTVHKVLSVISFLLAGTALFAQTTELDAYVEIALRQNPTLIASRLLENERSLGIELAAANRRPTVDLRSDYILAVGGRTLDFPVGDLFNPVYATLNEVANESRFPTNLENVNEQLMPNNFHDTRVEVRLPLLQPRIQREVALRRSQLREGELATETLRNNIRRQVRDLYYSYLLANEGVSIIDSARIVLTEVLRVNQVLVRNDKATADVVYRTESELAGLDGRTASYAQQKSVAAAALNRLLGRDVSTELAIASPDELPRTLAPLEELRTRGRAQRAELKQLDQGTSSLELLAELQNAGGKPTLDLFLNAGAQGFLDQEFDGQPYVTGGVAFNWSLYDGKKRGLQQQQTRLQGERLRQERADVANGVDVQVWQAWQRITNESAQLDAAEKAATAARASYRIIEAKYRAQQALLVELLDARNQVTQQELSINLSRFRLLQADAALRAALGE
ncbi:TolC family protein [Neolewinella antarctica]|uniref:Outer membrane protein TolC n=1 Tax=Neolewinella antarctica TaxID=442734 RepID=A0ABX0X8R7_9BACT|nr:TolC family protein [Neolewinella antarctica]NJC25645.1 outer membrane protein TolC [Neolewinella antarctica]